MENLASKYVKFWKVVVEFCADWGKYSKISPVDSYFLGITSPNALLSC